MGLRGCLGRIADTGACVRGLLSPAMEQLITIGQTPRTPTVAEKFMELARKEAEEFARLKAAAIAKVSLAANATALN